MPSEVRDGAADVARSVGRRGAGGGDGGVGGVGGVGGGGVAGHGGRVVAFDVSVRPGAGVWGLGLLLGCGSWGVVERGRPVGGGTILAALAAVTIGAAIEAWILKQGICSDNDLISGASHLASQFGGFAGSAAQIWADASDCNDDGRAYHYTNEAGMAGITACSCLRSSTEEGHVTYGTGGYFTDLPPAAAAPTSPEAVSLALYDTEDNAYKTTHYIEVDPDEVEPPMERQSLVYGMTFPGYWIFLSPTNGEDVALDGAITSSGKVPYW